MKKAYLRLLFLLILCIISSQSIYARDVSISTNKNSLAPDEDLVVTASISGFLPDETIYLKGAFFQDTTSNYFGYTKFNNDWVKNSAPSNSQKQVKISDWDLQTIIKNDSLDSGFKGGGNYKLKLGYYYVTSGGNLSAVNWSSNILDVSLSQPSVTPTLAPSFTLTPTPSKSPTSTITPIVIVTPTVIAVKVVIPKVTVKPAFKSNSNKGQVLGAMENENSKISPTILKDEVDSKFVMPPIFLIVGVLVIISACGILLFQEWKKQKTLEL